MIAERWNLTRAQVDELALESHARAAAATDSGAFESQISPIETEHGLISADEGIRRGGTPEGLGKLKTVFKEDGIVTAGNSSQISDGTALLMMSDERAKQLGLKPIARVHTAVLAALTPSSC